MIEKAIRAGKYHAIHRYVKAKNKNMNYDKKKESSYLKYWDVNNLYVSAISQLPVNGSKYLNDFKWDISEFDESNIKSYNEESNEWYFFEVDIQYLEHLQYHHNDLPFLPQRKVKKLVANLHDKTERVIYVRKLKQVSNDGLVKVKYSY